MSVDRVVVNSNGSIELSIYIAIDQKGSIRLPRLYGVLLDAITFAIDNLYSTQKRSKTR